MNWKIVADSSANLLAEAGVSSVPLRIMVGERGFVDDTALDVPTFLDALYRHKGRSSTACPGIEDWLAAFEGADAVFAVTITGALSGSCNAAGLLGIRVVGQASDKGELDPLHKCRGEARALETIVKEMTGRGYRGG